jgi:pimeloyl-ACP methyl ester carboxylesterase
MWMHDRLTEKQVEIGLCKISYLQGGDFSELSPILFLHGWGISAFPYREILNLLANHFPVIAPDLPSFAKSSYAGFLESYGRYAELIVEFLDHIHVDLVHLVGHSFGGGVAITIAAVEPKRVESLSLINTTGIPVNSLFDLVGRRAIEIPLQLLPAKWYLQWVEIPIVFAFNLLFNTQNIIQSLLLSLEKDLRPLLGTIHAPCLLLWSKQDLTTPISDAEELYHKIPNAQFISVEEGFHEWGLFYPERLTTLLVNFLNHVTIVEQHVV